VSDGQRARLLPLATELRLFGFGGHERGSSGLIKRVGYALPLTGLIRGFAIQALGLPGSLVQGPVSLISQINGISDDETVTLASSGEKPLLPGLKVN